MIAVTISPANGLDDGVVHTGTRIEVSLYEDFHEVEHYFTYDNEPVLRKVLNIPITDGKDRYVRGRYVVTPGGLQGWSQVVKVSPDDVDNIDIHILPPIKLPTPTITCPLGNSELPQTLIKFNVSNATSPKTYMWTLTNLDNVLHIAIEKDAFDNSFFIDGFLPPNTGYVLRCAVISENGTISQLAAYPFTIHSHTVRFGSIIGGSDKYSDDGKLISFMVRTEPEVDSLEMEIIKDGVVIKTFTSTGPTVSVEDIVPTTPYIIRIKYHTENNQVSNWDYLYVKSSVVSCSLPIQLPMPYDCSELVAGGGQLPASLPTDLNPEITIT